MGIFSNKYLDEYGGSVTITIIILIVFFVVVSYYYVESHSKQLRKNWNTNRCYPYIIPFAGIINKPENISGFDFTAQNFTYCTESILRTIAGYAMAPIYASMNIVNSIFKDMEEAISEIRTLFSRIRSDIASINKEIYSKMMNVTIPIQKMVIGMKDILNKSHGVFTTSLYTVFGSILTLQSALGAVYEIVVIILIALAASILIMWIIPFTWAAAATMTAIFASISIPLAAIAIELDNIFDNNGLSSIPHKPHCFDENTIIKTDNNELPIKLIKPGMVLRDGSTVTAIFKVSSNGQEMYNLNDIIVSGNHKVLLNKQWIETADHPISYKIKYDKDFIFCINTTNKKISINKNVFMDWDDLNNVEMHEINSRCKHLLPENIKNEDIHKHLEYGFVEGTLVETVNGVCSINRLKINDLLKGGGKVIGIVEICAENLKLYKYYHNKRCFIAGPNICLYDKELGILDSRDIARVPYKNSKYLYHILTSNNMLSINNTTCFDYNIGIEGYLEKENTELLLSLLRTTF